MNFKTTTYITILTLLFSFQGLAQVIDFTIASQSLDEDVSNFTLTVQMDVPSLVDITIPFTLSGTATEGVGNDYELVTLSPVTITASNTTADITVNLNDDTDTEPNETIIFTLGTPSSGSLGSITVHTTTILDNDTPPTVSILTPSDNDVFTPGQTINFTGTADDAEDGDLTDDIQWSSDINGSFGSGGAVNISTLSAGTHVITASVTDNDGFSDSDNINVTVNTAPTVSITAPADGSVFTPGQSINFTGTASDAEEGDLSASISWTSDLDGSLGSGASINTSTLTAGTHVITASVTDGNGSSDSDNINVTVNTAPTVSITAPANGSIFTPGQSINFTGTASDAEDGDLTDNIQWSSDLDGNIGSGGSINISTLSAGTHVITASVADSDGSSDSDNISVTVNSAPIASNVNITGAAEVGQTLTGNYDYSDAENDPEGTSTYRWLRNGSPISGATGISYTLVVADEGANIIFEVTPVAQSGVSPGSPVQSPSVGPVAPANTAPTATNVNITGTAEVGQTLTGNYTYDDADNDPEGTSTYRWLRNGSPISGAPVLAIPWWWRMRGQISFLR